MKYNRCGIIFELDQLGYNSIFIYYYYWTDFIELSNHYISWKIRHYMYDVSLYKLEDTSLYV